MPKKILAPLLILSAALFFTGGANASWLDKLKDTATELTDKAAEALKEAEPESPTTSDGEGQAKKPATTTAPAAPKAPAQSTVTAPSAPKTAAPAPAAPSGNNDTALVKATQTELKRLGYDIGVDGAYGPNTRKQIMAFEQSQSLEPSGDASVELLAKLKETPTPTAEPAATTTTTAAPAPAPKAEEPKAAEPKVEKAAAPAAATPSGDVLTAIFEKDEKYNGGRLAVEYPRGAQGQTEFFSVRWLITNNNEKYAEIAPVGQMRGKFKAWINTANNNYALEGLCDISCPRSVPEDQWAQVYDEFAALSETGGNFEFTIETNETFGPFKVTVPAANGSAQAKAEPAAAPAAAKKSLNPHDYDRAYAYEGSAPQLAGKWLLIKDRQPERFYAEIKDDELITGVDLRGLKPSQGFEKQVKGTGIIMIAREYFSKSAKKEAPPTLLIRFDNTVIRTTMISDGSHKVALKAKGPEVAALLAHVQAGNDFEFRVDNFEPFLYSKDWTTFSSPPPEIAAAKQAEKDKQAAAMAAAKAEQEQKAAYAGTLTPLGKIAFENCEQSINGKKYYSCQCMAENIEPYVDRTVASELEESRKLFTYHYGEDGKRAFEQIEKANLTAEQKAERKQRTQERMDKDKQHMAYLQNKAAWDDKTRERLVNTASIWAYKDPTCKIGETMRTEELARCEGSSAMKKIDCACYADTTAKLWTSSDRSYSSKTASYILGQARIQCRS